MRLALRFEIGIALAACCFGCGTSPGQGRTLQIADALDDVHLSPADAVDPGDNENRSDTSMDTEPDTVINVDSEDSGDVGPTPDSDIIEAQDAAEVGGCERFTLECLQEGEPVTSPVEVGGSSGDTLCTILGGASSDLYVWRMDYVDFPASRSVTRSNNYVVGAIAPGTAQLSVEIGQCVVEGPEFRLLAPEDVIYARVWWWPADEGARSIFGNEMDLHLLQSPDVCWFDRYQDLHFGSSEWLDWGVRFDRQDDPERGSDSNSIDGGERIKAYSIGEGEVWEVGVHARINAERPVPLTADIWLSRNGELLGRVRRTFTESAYWSVFVVGQEEFRQIDELTTEEPTCMPDEPVTCDGREASPETCNGIDDDCDGETDEYPDACYIGYGNYECILFRESPDYPYRCIEI
jgi:hypothetical protein